MASRLNRNAGTKNEWATSTDVSTMWTGSPTGTTISAGWSGPPATLTAVPS